MISPDYGLKTNEHIIRQPQLAWCRTGPFTFGHEREAFSAII